MQAKDGYYIENGFPIPVQPVKETKLPDNSKVTIKMKELNMEVQASEHVPIIRALTPKKKKKHISIEDEFDQSGSKTGELPHYISAKAYNKVQKIEIEQVPHTATDSSLSATHRELPIEIEDTDSLLETSRTGFGAVDTKKAPPNPFTTKGVKPTVKFDAINDVEPRSGVQVITISEKASPRKDSPPKKSARRSS